MGLVTSRSFERGPRLHDGAELGDLDKLADL